MAKGLQAGMGLLLRLGTALPPQRAEQPGRYLTSLEGSVSSFIRRESRSTAGPRVRLPWGHRYKDRQLVPREGEVNDRHLSPGMASVPAMAQGSLPWAQEGLATPQAVCWHSTFNYPHCWSLRGDESTCATQISSGRTGPPSPICLWGQRNRCSSTFHFLKKHPSSSYVGSQRDPLSLTSSLSHFSVSSRSPFRAMPQGAVFGVEMLHADAVPSTVPLSAWLRVPRVVGESTE